MNENPYRSPAAVSPKIKESWPYWNSLFSFIQFFWMGLSCSFLSVLLIENYQLPQEQRALLSASVWDYILLYCMDFIFAIATITTFFLTFLQIKDDRSLKPKETEK